MGSSIFDLFETGEERYATMTRSKKTSYLDLLETDRDRSSSRSSNDRKSFDKKKSFKSQSSRHRKPKRDSKNGFIYQRQTSRTKSKKEKKASKKEFSQKQNYNGNGTFNAKIKIKINFFTLVIDCYIIGSIFSC